MVLRIPDWEEMITRVTIAAFLLAVLAPLATKWTRHVHKMGINKIDCALNSAATASDRKRQFIRYGAVATWTAALAGFIVAASLTTIRYALTPPVVETNTYVPSLKPEPQSRNVTSSTVQSPPLRLWKRTQSDSLPGCRASASKHSFFEHPVDRSLEESEVRLNHVLGKCEIRTPIFDADEIQSIDGSAIKHGVASDVLAAILEIYIEDDNSLRPRLRQDAERFAILIRKHMDGGVSIDDAIARISSIKPRTGRGSYVADVLSRAKRIADFYWPETGSN